jgi:succinate dehydrogenase / fumarate reductase flavoprotein subunit
MDFAGVDPITEPIPIQPAQHYSMGGIDVGIDGQSGIPGLYAAGECACISVHGANRLGGNSLLETVVFGRLVADSIIRDIPSIPVPASGPVVSTLGEMEEKISSILKRGGGEPLFPIIDSLKETMYARFGIFRERSSMEEGLAEIRKLRERMGKISFSDTDRAANQTLVRYLELENMVPVAEAVALGAIQRTESRGSHTRTDFPARDDEHFLRHTITRIRNGGIDITYSPVISGMFSPEERVY